MSVTPVTSLAQFREIINGNKPAIFDFWATWCGPCKQISPVFEQLASKHASENVEFYKVDVDEQSDIAQEVGIRAMPTFAIFKNGEKLGDLVGANPDGLLTLVSKATKL